MFVGLRQLNKYIISGGRTSADANLLAAVFLCPVVSDVFFKKPYFFSAYKDFNNVPQPAKLN